MFAKRYTTILPNFTLIVLWIQKNKQKCNFHYAAMSMMTSQILKLLDFAKTQNLDISRTKHYFCLK